MCQLSENPLSLFVRCHASGLIRLAVGVQVWESGRVVSMYHHYHSRVVQDLWRRVSVCVCMCEQRERRERNEECEKEGIRGSCAARNRALGITTCCKCTCKRDSGRAGTQPNQSHLLFPRSECGVVDVETKWRVCLRSRSRSIVWRIKIKI